eukprot:1161433-Pelagomonas_calceolata.AAC.1
MHRPSLDLAAKRIRSRQAGRSSAAKSRLALALRLLQVSSLALRGTAHPIHHQFVMLSSGQLIGTARHSAPNSADRVDLLSVESGCVCEEERAIV